VAFRINRDGGLRPRTVPWDEYAWVHVEDHGPADVIVPMTPVEWPTQVRSYWAGPGREAWERCRRGRRYGFGLSAAWIPSLFDTYPPLAMLERWIL